MIYCFREEGDDSVPSLLVNSDERWQLVLLKFGHVQEDMRRNSHSKLGFKQTKLFFIHFLTIFASIATMFTNSRYLISFDD